MTDFGKRIRKLRMDAGLTQEHVAFETGITGCTLRTYETKDTLPRVDRAVDLASYFHVTVEYLLTGKKPK